MAREMLINVTEGEECRIAVVEDGVLQELYMERSAAGSQVGNIYKGRVTNVEPSIQAAFIDYGAPKHGFLHISDLLPQYFPQGQREVEQVGRKRDRKSRPPIQACLRRGQEVVVQLIKEGIGTKGPTLTTYLSIPGRFVVMMPGMRRHGVSRKIEDEEERQKLRQLLTEIKPPEDMGFIVRTAGMDRAKKDLQQDLNYLLRLWRSVDKRLKTTKAPAELYQESDLVIRTIRDVFTSEIHRIVCDDDRTVRKIAEFLQVVMPRGKNEVKLYSGNVPLFHRYDLEREIESTYARRVELPTGGSLVIDQAEAMVAVDVNSGRNRSSNDAEETAYRTNLVAAKEIARQLRLRDVGGVIAIDFIDMRAERHLREIERVLRDSIKGDRARTKILKMSRFCIVEMTRQRVRPSLKHSIYRECPHCRAAGFIKSDESMALAVIRDLQMAVSDERIARINLSVPPGVAEHINNTRRSQLSRLEARAAKRIRIHARIDLAGDEAVFECLDARGSVIPWAAQPAVGSGGRPAAVKPLTPEELVDVSDLPARAAPEPVAMLAEPSAETAAAVAAEREAIFEETRLEEGGEGDFATPEPPEEPEVPAAPAVQPSIIAVAAGVPVAPGAMPAGALGEGPGHKRHRRRRGGRKHRRHGQPGAPAQPPAPVGQAAGVVRWSPVEEQAAAGPAPVMPPAAEAAERAVEPTQSAQGEAAAVAAGRPQGQAPQAPGEGGRRRHRRRRRGKGGAAPMQPGQPAPGRGPASLSMPARLSKPAATAEKTALAKPSALAEKPVEREPAAVQVDLPRSAEPQAAKPSKEAATAGEAAPPAKKPRRRRGTPAGTTARKKTAKRPRKPKSQPDVKPSEGSE